MSATYRTAIRTVLPHATVAVDHFHVVQLANKMSSMVRHRTTAELRGRRGRAADPQWKAATAPAHPPRPPRRAVPGMWNPLLDEQRTAGHYRRRESPRRTCAPSSGLPAPAPHNHARWNFPHLVRRGRHPRDPAARHHRLLDGAPVSKRSPHRPQPRQRATASTVRHRTRRPHRC
jgi:hypothetical protein